jgi:hypothetical protein
MRNVDESTYRRGMCFLYWHGKNPSLLLEDEREALSISVGAWALNEKTNAIFVDIADRVTNDRSIIEQVQALQKNRRENENGKT